MKAHIFVYLKGLAMGAVDVVPGFSGGTVALIAGIYHRILAAFSAIPDALLLLLRGKITSAWKRCDATFMLLLVAGILTSIFTLAKAISHLMTHHPVPLWSFFFGLVLVSVYLVGREVQRWSGKTAVLALCGFLFALFITLAVPLQLQINSMTLFLAGAIAISAMLLPGVSGSFILVLLGLYPVVLGAVKNLDVPVLLIFSAGCLLGLLMFSRLLSWLLDKARDVTMAFLAGLMLGSLVKVWPWKQTLTWQTNRHGETFPLHQENIWPQHFTQLTGEPNQLVWALLLAVSAVIVVLLLEYLASRRNRACI